MATMIIIVILLGLVICALRNSLMHFKGHGGCCGKNDETESKEKSLVFPQLGTISVRIEGMHCLGCVHKVKKALNQIDGVSAQVDLGSHKALISYDRPIDIQEIHHVIENVGYKIKSIN